MGLEFYVAVVMPADPSTITGTLKNQYTIGTFDMNGMLHFFQLLFKVYVSGLRCFYMLAKIINGLLAVVSLTASPRAFC